MTADPHLVAGNIRRNLRKISDYYDAALRRGKQADENGGRAGANSGEPVDLHAVDLRRNALTCLGYWREFITDEVGATINGDPIPTNAATDSIPELASFVDKWALHLAEQLPDDANNCERETHRHGSRLEEHARGWLSKRIRIPGRCPELNFVVSAQGIEELVPCEGELWSEFREEDNGLLPRTVVCDADRGHSWAPHEWAYLGKRVGTIHASIGEPA